MSDKFDLKKSFTKIEAILKSVIESDDRAMPRTADHLKEFYAESTKEFLEGGRELVLDNRQVRFIAFCDYALNHSGKKPPVVNVKVDPEFNPHVVRVVNGSLRADVMDADGTMTFGALEIDEFLEYFRIGAFVFVDFKS